MALLTNDSLTFPSGLSAEFAPIPINGMLPTINVTSTVHHFPAE